MSRLDVAAAHAELRAEYRRALERKGGSASETLLEIAGSRMRLRVAGANLATALVRTFAHLRVGDTAQVDAATRNESSIDIWSSDETTIPAPARAWPSPRGMASSADGVVTIQVERGSITALDRRDGSIVGRRESVAGLAPSELAKPFAEILALLLLDRGATTVHGAMVARAGAGVLIAGGPGAGKSTTSLACAAAGMEWLGDDQVALTEMPDRTLVAHSLYSVARIDAAFVQRHPVLSCGLAPIEAAREKSLLFLAEAVGVRIARSAVPRTIVVPTVRADRRHGLAPIGGAAALRALAPSSLLGVIGGGAAGFARLAGLVERIPCFEVCHGGEPRRIAELVDEALRRVGVA